MASIVGRFFGKPIRAEPEIPKGTLFEFPYGWRGMLQDGECRQFFDHLCGILERTSRASLEFRIYLVPTAWRRSPDARSLCGVADCVEFSSPFNERVLTDDLTVGRGLLEFLDCGVGGVGIHQVQFFESFRGSEAVLHCHHLQGSIRDCRI